MCSLLSKLVAVIAVAVIVVAVIVVAIVVAKGMANGEIVYLQHVLSSVKTCRCHRCRCQLALKESLRPVKRPRGRQKDTWNLYI